MTMTKRQTCFEEVQRRADVTLSLRGSGSPTSYEQACDQLRQMLWKMLSSTRVMEYGNPSAGKSAILCTDYSGMGTAEFAASELQDH